MSDTLRSEQFQCVGENEHEHSKRHTMSSPIFIVGANRSGTTLLRLILNAHPRIAIPDELFYFDTHLQGLPVEQWRQPGLSTAAYEDFVDRFLSFDSGVIADLDREAVKRAILLGSADLRRPYECVLEAWATEHGKARWGEKTPGNLFYVDILYDMFPEAHFLYVVRDPRAGVASMQDVSFFPNDVMFNALSRRKYDTAGRALLEKSIPRSQRMTVRYEDLVRDPQETIRSVCEFVEEEFVPGMLHFHEDAGTYMKDEAEQSYNATATHPITDEYVDAWTDRLTPRQVGVVESVCAEVMETAGYVPTDRDLSAYDRVTIAVKRAYWAYQEWKARDARHYTVKHPLFARTRTRLQSLLRGGSRALRWISPFHTR